ncbi:sel1 repeat family protein [Luteimonas viscosa]|uniref:Sel1 repeat family protein n=1 Tax=Luteimonas viscosa TaxID=1132694 RepID=A0A5D4XKH2_9GAMM|nr:sel1 repeat family protein [Luteimonas viscosa]TYT25156.1 sel1 repeat family protein [Luteimonas viscosa]
MKKMIRSIRFQIAIAAVLAAPAAWAQQAPLPPDPTEDRLMINAGFLSAHPDLRYRLLGLEDMRAGREADALRFFMRASYYADKPSQGMVAEMFWNGQGVEERDPAKAYAWMDLAAERGYEGFVALRERYWASLDEAQRQSALEHGQEIYAKYGDDAAQPRLTTAIRRGRNRITGSRVGAVGSLQIYVPGPAGFEQIDGSKFFDEKYWDPEQYMAWHDAIWMKPRVGKVTVGEIRAANDAPIDATSRIPHTAPLIDATEPATPERDEQGLGAEPLK